jgi:hypothetical protein
MNTFFPTLQLFFESGLSCTLDGSGLPEPLVGLDPSLRFRLTDCTYEENGCVFKTTRPEKFVGPGTGICIEDAIIARRTSVAVKPCEAHIEQPSSQLAGARARLSEEVHTVIGLRLRGMSTMSFVWAKARPTSVVGERTWGNVRIGGLREDMPAPILGLPLQTVKPGGEIAVLSKKSQIRETGREMDRR